jgi:DNA-binding transcriptional LysR family regulator
MDTWAGVELRHLAALCAVHDARSFRGAADRLGYVQSAVSQQIAQVERLVGMRLVERTRGHAQVSFTPAGEVLVGHAQRILSQLVAAHADVRALAAGGGGRTLAVGVCHSLGSRLLPRALTLLAAGGADVPVTVREALVDRDLFPLVETGELDAAFAELPLEPGPFAGRELLEEPLVLVVPAGSPLAGRPVPPGLDEIAASPLITNSSWRITSLVDAQFAAAGIEPDRHYVAGSDTAVQAFVGAGLGVAIEPRLAVDPADPGIEAVELGAAMPACRIACYWHRERQPSPALDAFVSAMQVACDEARARREPPLAMRLAG